MATNSNSIAYSIIKSRLSYLGKGNLSRSHAPARGNEINGFQAAKEWRIFYQVETIEGQRSDFAVGFVRTDTDETNVTVKAIVNQPVYQAFRFEVMVAGEGNFDLYVGSLFPKRLR